MLLIHLFSGKRTISGTIFECIRHRLLAGAHALFIAIHIEELSRSKKLAACRADATRKLFMRNLFVYHEGNVHGYRREYRHINVVASRTGSLDQGIKIELECNDGSLSLKDLCRHRMDFSNPAKHGTAGKNLCSTSRLQMGSLFCGKGLEARLRDCQFANKVFDNAPAVEEVEGNRLAVPGIVAHSTSHNGSKALALLGLLVALGAEEHHAGFVELNVVHATGLVVSNAAHKARDDGLAHNRLLSIKRIQEFNGNTHALSGHAQLFKFMRVGERVRHGLVQARCTHSVVNHVERALSLGSNTEATATARQGGFDAVHAVQAQDLFVQIDFTRKVGAEGGSRNLKDVLRFAVFNLTAQTTQNVHDELAGDLSAHHAIEAIDAELQMRLFRLYWPYVDDAVFISFGVAYGAARNSSDKGGGGGRALFDAMIVYATLVAHRAFRDKTQVAAGAAGAASFKRSRFQQNVGGFFRNLSCQAAHNASQGNCALIGRRDNRHVGRKHAFFAIKRGDFFALFSSANNDVCLTFGVLQLAQIERMERLTEQEQDVVGYVNDVVDGTLTDGSQTLYHPVGAGAHLAATDNTSGIAGATSLVGDGNAYLGIEGSSFLAKLELASHLGQGARVGFLVHGSHFARHAHHGKAVGAIRSDFQIEYGIGHLQVVGNGLASRGIVGKHPNAIVFVAHAQLALRAAHATARNATKLRLLNLEVAREHRADGGYGNLDARSNVGSTAHDLHRFFGTHIYCSYMHMIAVGMVDTGKHMADDNAVEYIARTFHALNASTGEV